MVRERWELPRPKAMPCGPNCVGCQLAPHAPKILKELASLVAAYCQDKVEHDERLRTAVATWSAMAGPPEPLDVTATAAAFRKAFRHGHHFPLDTLTAYGDLVHDPPPVIHPRRPLPDAHRLEGPLLWALVPFLLHQTEQSFVVGDEPQDLFMDGLVSLFEHLRRGIEPTGATTGYDRWPRGVSLYKHAGHWRTCPTAVDAFEPFPAGFDDLVLTSSPNTPVSMTLNATHRGTRTMSPLPRVLKLVHQATDLKLLRHRTRASLALLAEADALCDAHPELPGTIRGLIAYRMGHLRMRGRSDIRALLDAEQDFRRACRLGQSLQPWASLYHLAVLGRLRALRPDPAIPDTIEQRLQTRWQDVLHQQAILDPTLEPERDDPIVQRGSLNTTEALGYALGLDLAGLEGLGSLEHSLHAELDWGVLVGRGLEQAHVRIPWAMLTPTLMQLREQHPDWLVYSLPARGHESLLWRPGQGRAEPISRLHAALITWVLQGCPDGYSGLDHAVYGRASAAATRRKLVQRAREWLAGMTPDTQGAVLERVGEQRLALAPDLTIYGAVHRERGPLI